MKLFAHWPEGCIMDAVVNYDVEDVKCVRLGFQFPWVNVFVVLPRRCAWRERFRVRIVAGWKYPSPFLFNRGLYYEFDRHSLVVDGQRISMERLQSLAHAYGRKVEP